MRIRSTRQALAAAVRLLGKRATVRRFTCSLQEERPRTRIGPAELKCWVWEHGRGCPGGREVYQIGRIVMGLFNEINGQGASWDEALARAAVFRHEHGCSACFEKRPCPVGDELRAAVARFKG